MTTATLTDREQRRQALRDRLRAQAEHRYIDLSRTMRCAAQTRIGLPAVEHDCANAGGDCLCPCHDPKEPPA